MPPDAVVNYLTKERMLGAALCECVTSHVCTPRRESPRARVLLGLAPNRLNQTEITPAFSAFSESCCAGTFRELTARFLQWSNLAGARPRDVLACRTARL